jgi:hypothetical protein
LGGKQQPTKVGLVLMFYEYLVGKEVRRMGHQDCLPMCVFKEESLGVIKRRTYLKNHSILFFGSHILVFYFFCLNDNIAHIKLLILL